MTSRQILFVQGGGAGAHDQWDNRLVDSLTAALGDGYSVRYPYMPDEDDPSLASWGPVVRREIAGLADGSVVVGNSVGAAILVDARTEPSPALAGIVLVSAPFVGAGGWPGEEFELLDDLGARLSPGARVHVFHGLAAQTAPAAHAELYGRAIPQAQVHLLPGRDHQLNDDLSEVAAAVTELSTRR